MSNFAEYPAEFNAMFEGRMTCHRITMNYVDGGAQESYRAWVTPSNGAPKVVEVTIPANTHRAQIFDAIAGAANAQDE